MDKSMILPGIFYIITEITLLVKGDCNVPTYWYTPSYKQYWLYNDPSGASAMWMARYDSTGYNVALMPSKNQLQAMALNYLCYDTYRPDPNGPTTYMVRVSFNQFSCRVMTTTESALLVREKVVPSGTSATSCQQSNNMSPEAFWEVQYPELTGKTCPFPEGDYQVTVQGGYFCTGNTQTAVRVQGENVRVYCVPNNGIANEVGRMICYDSLAGSVLDNDANGGILLIEDRTVAVYSGRLNYKCARYGTSGSTVSIKIRLSDTHALCESGVGYSAPNTQDYTTLTMTTSGNIFPNPDQTTPPLRATIGPEPCAFPAEWRVPKLWWYLTGPTGQVVYVQEFSTKEMRQRSVITDPDTGSGTIATIGVYQCSDQKIEGASRMYVRYQLDVSSSRRCVEYVRVPDTSSGSTPDALMMRESQLGESLTAAECSEELIRVKDFKLLVPFPFDPLTKSCNFDPGYYSTTYGTNPIQEVCAGQTSTTAVTSNTLVMNTCSTTSTYEMPLNTRLSCVTSFAATNLYDADRDDGDFTILAYQDPVSDRHHYYCARYRKLGNDIVMSLNVENKYETICDTTARFDTAGLSNEKQYVRFTMKYIQALSLTTYPGQTFRTNRRTTLPYVATTLPGQTTLPGKTTLPGQGTTTLLTTSGKLTTTLPSTSAGTTLPTTAGAVTTFLSTPARTTLPIAISSTTLSSTTRRTTLPTTTLPSTGLSSTTESTTFSNAAASTVISTTHTDIRTSIGRFTTSSLSSSPPATTGLNFATNSSVSASSWFDFVTHITEDTSRSGVVFETTGLPRHTSRQEDLTTLPPGVTVKRNSCTDCLNNAECITNNLGVVTCLCNSGTTGTRCETDLPFGRCEDKFCNLDNTRECTNTEGGYYYCECQPGYDGPRCETNYNECSSSPCLNGGACQDSTNGYTCQCTVEFAGQSCEFRVASASGSDSSDLTVLIVLICLLAAVVLAVVVVSVCMCHYRSEQREKSLIVDNDEISQAYGGSSMQAWYPDYKSNNSDSGSIGRHP